MIDRDVMGQDTDASDITYDIRTSSDQRVADALIDLHHVDILMGSV